ncbi:MAG: manganese efflux pump MntP family protein [Polyangiaceae bacterium]|nr:manganese efflux pump MntP family protein [Polyangiaceae bacterium]
MSPSALFLLAVGLAMDAAAVSAARGLSVPRILPRHVALVALFFGGFQALMPLIGWWAGTTIGPWVQAFTHYIAFILLAAIGAKMLWEARDADDLDDGGSTSTSNRDPFALAVMLMLAIATSIDALAVGVTLPMLNAALWPSLFVIGITTAILSALGLFAGRAFGSRLGKRLDTAGGLVLIGLGTKILLEHLLTR